MSIRYILSGILALVVTFVIGVNLSNEITNNTLYLLFWFMYLITIMTIIAIGMSIVFYFVLKDKKGPSGPRGDSGDSGDTGEVGKCTEGCRNQICYKKTIEIINTEVNILAGNPDKEIIVKNVYIRNKVKQICASDEFSQLVPYRGPNDLIKYISVIWKEWIGLIYKAGGRAYFESLGAENDFEWVGDNPFDEIKKYDIFYWGLGEDYHPEIIKKCSKARKGNNLPEGIQKGHPSFNKDSKSGESVNIGRGWQKTGKMADKYSIIRYLNLVPETELLEKDTQRRYYAKTADTSEPNSYTIQEYDPVTKDFGLCMESIIESGKTITKSSECDPNNKGQLWKLELDGNKTKETKIISENTNNYLGKDNGVFKMI